MALGFVLSLAATALNVIGGYEQADAQKALAEEQKKAAQDAANEKLKLENKQIKLGEASESINKLSRQEELRDVQGAIQGKIAYNTIKTHDNQMKASLKEGLAMSMGINDVTKLSSFSMGKPAKADNHQPGQGV